MALVLLLGACGQQAETGDTSETAVHNQNAGEDTTVEVAETQAVVVAEDAVIGLSKQSGIYEGAFSLTMEAPAGYRIYYTLDGRDPTDAAVDKAVCLRAACVNANGEWSRETRANYFIGDVQQHIPGIKESCEAAGSRLAVICMTVNEEDLFDHANGIYVKGDRFEADYLEPYVKGDARNADANYKGRGREWEREASIEFYEVDEGGMDYAFGQNCGIRIQGNYSRSDLQKSFRFYARFPDSGSVHEAMEGGYASENASGTS